MDTNSFISNSFVSKSFFDRENVRFFSQVKLDGVGKGEMLGFLQFIFYPRRLGIMEELHLLQEDGLGDLMGSYLLNGAIEASCLKDRIVHCLISVDTLLEFKREDGYFTSEFQLIVLKISKLVTNAIFDNPLQEDVLGIALIKPKNKKNKTKETLENLANFIEKTFSIYIEKLLEMHQIYSVRGEIPEKEIMEKIDVCGSYKEGIEEINHSNIIMATASNWHYQHLKNVYDHFLNRIRGSDSIVSFMSNYELLKLYALLKQKVNKIPSASMKLSTHESRLLNHAYELLSEVIDAKERVAMVNKLIVHIASPKQKKQLDHHQKCLDELAENSFKKYLRFFGECTKKAQEIFLQVNRDILDCELSFVEEIRAKKELFLRLMELIDYRLKGDKVPKYFSAYVNALTNQGSLRGQLDNLGEYVYLTGERKGKKVIAKYINCWKSLEKK